MPLTRSKVLEPPQDHLLKRPGMRPAQAKIIRQDHRERTRAAWAPSGGPGRTDPYQLISPFSSSERARTHLIHGLAAVSGRGPERSAGSSGFPIEPCTGGCRTPSVQRAPTARPAVIPPGAAVMACPVVASGSGDHASSQRAISAAARAHNGQSACHRPGNRACRSSHADSAFGSGLAVKRTGLRSLSVMAPHSSFAIVTGPIAPIGLTWPAPRYGIEPGGRIADPREA